MENSNNEQYIYLLVVRTLGVDKTTLTYEVIPFTTLDKVNNAVLNFITDCVKANKEDVSSFHCTSHDYIDKSNFSHVPFGSIDFKSGTEKTYKVLLRRINGAE